MRPAAFVDSEAVEVLLSRMCQTVTPGPMDVK